MKEDQSAENKAPDARIELLKLYVKDISMQIPEGAKAFQLEWQPELNFEINTQAKSLAEANHYEVTLRIKCTNTCKGTVAFNIEMVQAGLFKIENLQDQPLQHAMATFCPNLLYPFVREAVGDMVTRAGFPQLNLAAVNFDALYQQSLAEQNSATIQ
jgi:preprotein translocase subunit SecB